MDTTFKSADSRDDVHRVACLDCHAKGAPKRKAFASARRPGVRGEEGR
jgi:hypothetical protein